MKKEEIEVLSVAAINEKSTGTWVVKTQGSQHIWNLDEGYYIRVPGRASLNGLDLYSMRRLPLGDVEHWPEVGKSFVVLHPNSDLRWHQSSTIRAIEKFDEKLHLNPED